MSHHELITSRTQAVAREARLNGGFLLFSDYRGVPVIAELRKIPDSPWSLVAKIDASEVFAPLDATASRIAGVVIILLLSLGAGLSLIWRQQAARFYRQQYEAEVAHQALERQYRMLARYANDIILLANPDGSLLSANERALGSYGYTREELMNLNLRDLVEAKRLDELNAALKKLEEKKGLVFETMHRRKNGTEFPVEVSARMIDVEGTIFLQCIIRDTTERENVLRALRESEERFATIFREIPEMVTISSMKEGRYLDVNNEFEKTFGYSKPELIGHSVHELGFYVDPEDRSRVLQLLEEKKYSPRSRNSFSHKERE